MDNKTAIEELKRVLKEIEKDKYEPFTVDESVSKYILDDYILIEAIEDFCYFHFIIDYLNSKISANQLKTQCKGFDDCRESHHNEFKADESQEELVTYFLAEFLTSKNKDKYEDFWNNVFESGATDSDSISEPFIEKLINLLSENKPRKAIVRTISKDSLLAQKTNLNKQINKHQKEINKFQKELVEVDKMLATL